MSYEAKGKITAIGDEMQVTEKFKKRVMEITQVAPGFNGEEYTNILGFEFHNAKCDLSNGLNVGDEVNVKFGITSNRNTKATVLDLFTKMKVMSIDVLNKAQTTATPTPVAQVPQPLVQPEPQTYTGTRDDLPF